MKSLRLHAIGKLQLHDEPIPTPAPGEALLRVTAVGVCGSDLHWYDAGSIGDDQVAAPFILGHEFAATVEWGEHKGQRVAVEPCISCGKCEFCLEGNPNLCPHHYFAGLPGVDGAFRQYMAWPEHALFPVPDSISDVDAAMLEPLGVAIHSLDLGKIRPGMTVGIYGAGPIGLLALQLARRSGASQVFVTDILPHRLDAALELGAAAAIQATPRGEERTQIMAATRGRGVDLAFEFAGENSAVETAVETVKPGGKVILCGIPENNNVTSFRASTARRKGLTIKMVRRMKLTYPRAIRLVENGQVDVRCIVSHQFPLEQYEQAFSIASRRDGLKVVIVP